MRKTSPEFEYVNIQNEISFMKKKQLIIKIEANASKALRVLDRIEKKLDRIEAAANRITAKFEIKGSELLGMLQKDNTISLRKQSA